MSKERPALITVLCILGFIGVPVSVAAALLVLNPAISKILEKLIPAWYAIFTLIFAIFYLISFYQIWKMRKVGVLFLTALVVIDQATMFTLGIGHPLFIMLDAIFVGLFFLKYQEME